MASGTTQKTTALVVRPEQQQHQKCIDCCAVSNGLVVAPMRRGTEGKMYIYDSQQATNDRLKVYRCASSPVVNGIPGEAGKRRASLDLAWVNGDRTLLVYYTVGRRV